MTKLLVCGSRYWTNKLFIDATLNHFQASLDKPEELQIIEGECIGADEMAGDWAEQMGVPIITREPWIAVRPNRRCSVSVNNGARRGFPALWHIYRHAAGPIRNKEMLTVGKPDVVMAFHNDIENSAGTKGMLNISEKAGVETILVFKEVA